MKLAPTLMTAVVVALIAKPAVTQESTANGFKTFGLASGVLDPSSATLIDVVRRSDNVAQVRYTDGTPPDRQPRTPMVPIGGDSNFIVPYRNTAVMTADGNANADSYLFQSFSRPSDGQIGASAFAKAEDTNVRRAVGRGSEEFTSTVSANGTMLVIPAELNARVIATFPDRGRANVFDPVQLSLPGEPVFDPVFETKLHITGGEAKAEWTDVDGDGIPEGGLTITSENAVGYFTLGLNFELLEGASPLGMDPHLFCYEFNLGACPQPSSGIFAPLGESTAVVDLRSILNGVNGAQISRDGFLLMTLDPAYANIENSLVSFSVTAEAEAFSADCNGDGEFAGPPNVDGGLQDLGDLPCINPVGPDALDQLLLSSELLKGDLNVDREVNFADFLILSTNFNTAVDSYLDGDVDADGLVGFSDFLFVSENFGQSSGAAAVPEPTTGTILLVGIILSLWRRRLPRGTECTTRSKDDRSVAALAGRIQWPMNNHGVFLAIAILSFLLLGRSVLFADPILIDDFSSGAQSVNGTSSPSNVAASSALGGSRFLASVGSSAGGKTSVIPAAGQLIHDNPASNTGIWSVVVDWEPIGGLDLTGGGANDRFVLDVSDLSGLESSVSVGVTDTSGAFMGFNSFLPLDVGRLTAPFSGFRPNPGVSNIDFSLVGAVRLQVNSLPGASVTLESLRVVPEVGVLLGVTGGIDSSGIAELSRLHQIGTLLGQVGATQPTTLRGLNSLAQGPSGQLLSVASSTGDPHFTNQLVRIDPVTGTSTLLGNLTNISNPDIRALAADKAGNLYGIQNGRSDPHGRDPLNANDWLVQIAGNGHVNSSVRLHGSVGAHPLLLEGLQALEFDAAGNLWAWDSGRLGAGLVQLAPNGLVSDVNMSTGSAVPIQSLAFASDGRLFGAGPDFEAETEESHALYEIDTLSGVATRIVDLGLDDIRGLGLLHLSPVPAALFQPSDVQHVPEPTNVLVTLLAAWGSLHWCRRRTVYRL